MVRPLRLSFENTFYHITARGNRREKIFYSPRDKEVFLKRLKEMLIKYTMTCHAYCLMDNHYLLFIKTTKPNGSKAAKTFFRFTLAFRSRQSVCQQTLSDTLGKTWYTMFDEW